MINLPVFFLSQYRHMNRRLYLIALLIGLLLFGYAVWETQFKNADKLVTFERTPEGIMGTSCRLLVVADYRDKDIAKKILDKAEFRIRYIESVASNWIDESEISNFNAAPALSSFEFGEDNWIILQYAYKAYSQTYGVFDITCRPLIELWKEAGKKGELPSDEAIQRARVSSSWKLLEFGDDQTITKKGSGVRVDLGGVAKGYAIDQAAQAMMELGAVGGLVDIGGDIRVFGKSSREDGCWAIEVQDPFKPGTITEIKLCEGQSVCTSGDYARYVEIGGKRYSHIIDPVSGYPTKRVPSVTVMAEEAMVADVWATALSVMGPKGMQSLPEGVETLMIYGDQDFAEVYRTPSFPVQPETGVDSGQGD